MATMFPEAPSPATESRAEVRLFEALRDGLDDDFVAFHHVAWLAKGREGARVGEADFVLAHPRLGAVVVEAKGGRIRYDAERRQFYSANRSGEFEIKDPFEQARRSAFALADALRIQSDPPPHIGYAVAFPDAEVGRLLKAAGANRNSHRDTTMVLVAYRHGLRPIDRELLEYAALLHEIGKHVSYQGHHKHTYYLIRHAGLKGFTGDQIAELANVARYYRKSPPEQSDITLSEVGNAQRHVVQKLSAILRIASALDRGRRVLLVEPQSFMNLSGGPTLGLSTFYKIPPSRMLVVVDELDLPFGTLRMRSQGSSGGHNGLKSLIEAFGSNFARLRVGIGRDHEGDAIDRVLGPFSEEEERALPAIVDRAVAGVDRGSVADRLPRRPGLPGVARGDLPVGLRPTGVHPGQGADQLRTGRKSHRGGRCPPAALRIREPATSTNAPPRRPTGYCMDSGETSFIGRTAAPRSPPRWI